MSKIQVETPRFKLRKYTDNDIQKVLELRSTPASIRFVRDTMTAEEARRHVERRLAAWHAEEPRELGFVIEPKPELCFAGEALLHIGCPEASQAEVGCGLLPEHQGRRLGTEVIVALLCCAFEQLVLHRVFVLCDVDNHPANALARSIHLKAEGVLRHNAFREGAWRDERIYSILEPEWREARNELIAIIS
jgi:RimJ/RimL family protein N-acetyltransferase